MFDLSSLISFIGAVILLNITPGADVLFVCGQSIKGGKGYGILATLGISTGHLFYVIGSALGIAEIFKISPTLFMMFKIAGAAYLLYLAYKTFTASDFIFDMEKEKISKSFFKAYHQGIITTILNPKVGIFFLTFLPQFINLKQENITLQLLILGSIFIVSGTCVNMGYAIFFSRLRGFFISSVFVRKYLHRIIGTMFAGLALKVLWTEK